MDWTLYRWMNRVQARTAWAHGVAIAYAREGILVFGLLLVAAWWLGRSTGARAVASAVSAGLAAVVAYGVNEIVGHVFDRPRPYATHVPVHLLVLPTSEFSLPSNHTAVAGAVAMGLLYSERRLGIIAAVAAAAMALTQVYVGAHYPGDVVAGLALGAVVAVGVGAVTTRPLTRLIEHMAATRLRRLVRS